MEILVSQHPATKYVVIFGIALLFSLLLTPFFSSLAYKLGMIDHPGGRHLHKSPTPRGVGIVLYFTFHLCCILVFAFPDFFSTTVHTNTLTHFTWWAYLFIATTVLVVSGLYDDRWSLKPYAKLSAQVLASCILFIGGTQFEGALGLHFPFLLNLLCTLVWFIILINAFNLIDGYDGLATGIAIIAAIGIAGTFLYRHLIIDTLILTAFVGSCLGFLRYNIHPAKVFLGDTGSMFLGIVLAAITLKTTSKGTALAAIWIPLLALGIPLFDTFLAIWRRLARKILSYLQRHQNIPGIMSCDTEHLHHRLLTLGVTPRNITAILYLANCALVIAGMTLLFVKDTSLALFFGTFLVGSFLCVRYTARRELRDSGRVIVAAFRSPESRILAATLYVCADMLVIGFVGMAVYFSSKHVLNYSISYNNLFHWWNVSVFILLLVFHVPYRFIITNEVPSPRSEWLLFLVSWLVFLLSLLLLNRDPSHYPVLLKTLSLGATIFCISLLRIIPRLVEDILKEKGHL